MSPKLPVTSHIELAERSNAAPGREWQDGGDKLIENTPTDTDPRVRPLTLFATHWWLWEIAACLWSLSLFLTVAIILGVLNGKPAPVLQKGLTLHGIVAIASTLCKASDIVFVAEGISQLKWTEFSARQHSLFTFDVYDQASRGAWGALVLLVRVGPKAIVSLGAFVMILALGFEASVQQSITYPVVQAKVAPNLAKFPVSHGQRALFPKPAASDYYPFISANASVSKALWQSASPKDTPPPLNMECSGSVCEWKNVTTAGICSRCSERLDIFSREKRINGTCQGEDAEDCVGDGFDLAFGKSFLPKPVPSSIQIYTANQANQSYAFKDLKGFITTTYQVLWRKSQDASECALYFCARRVNMNYTLNKLAIDTIQQWPMVPGEKAHGVYLNITQDTRELLSSSLSSTLTGNISLQDGGQSTIAFALGQAFDRSPFTEAMADMAVSMTMDAWNNDETIVDGRSWNEITVVRVRWRWLVLPAVVQLLSVAFFVVSMIASRRYEREGVWKSSSLAALLHTIEPEQRDKLAKAETIYDMEQKSKAVRVQLKRNQKGYRQLIASGG